MKTIETIATVDENRRMTVQLPPDIPPGEHRVVLVIDDKAPAGAQNEPAGFEFPVDAWGAELADLSLRREDLYDDWGR